MNFCPFCGNQIGQAIDIINSYENKEIIEKSFHDKQYDQLLDFAMAGDNIAKGYYIEYVGDQAVKGYFYDWDSIFEKLISAKNNGNSFAIAAYGIFQYEQAKKGALGVSDTNTMEHSYKLIEKAANMNEPAAMTELGVWLCDGTDYVKKDEYRGYQLIKRAADMGYPQALRILGYWHYKGSRNISVNEDLGFELIERAAFMGEYSARHIILEENPDWLNDALTYSTSNETVESIVQLLKEPISPVPSHIKENSEKDERKSEIFALLEKCCSLDDYKLLHKQLKKRKDATSEEVQGDLRFIEMIIGSILGISITSENVENAENVKADVEKVENLIGKYTCPQHFLHFKGDLKRLNLSFEESVMNDLMDRASETLNAKCKKEYEAYQSYLDGVYLKDSSKGSLAGIIFWTILAFVVGAFFLPVGIVIGVIAGIMWLSLIFSKSAGHTKTISSEQDFRLINSLFGYGYKIGKISEYYKDMPYTNTIGSVLGDKMSHTTTKDKNNNSEQQESNNRMILCPSCKKENIFGAKYCKYCGSSMISPIVCSNCGSSVKQGAKFCSKCGNKIVE